MDQMLQKQFGDIHAELDQIPTLSKEHKDQFRAALYKAEFASNGAPDKIQAISEALALWVIIGVSNAIRMPDEVRSAIEQHSKSCREMFYSSREPNQINVGATSVRNMTWKDVAKLAVLRCPYAAAGLAAIFVLRGFGDELLKLFTLQ